MLTVIQVISFLIQLWDLGNKKSTKKLYRKLVKYTSIIIGNYNPGIKTKKIEPFLSSIPQLEYGGELEKNKQTPEELFKTIISKNGDNYQVNLLACVLRALLLLKDVPDSEISDEEFSDLFFSHWKNEAEFIDDPDLIFDWASILVEEIKKPNSISLRTLDTFIKLTKDEKELFEKLSKYIILDLGIIIYDHPDLIHPVRETHNRYGVTDIYKLVDARLVSSIQDIYLKILPVNSLIHVKSSNTQFLNIKFNSVDLDCLSHTFNGFYLTQAGVELFKLIKIKHSNELLEYQQQILEHLNPESDFSIYFTEE